MTWLEQLDGLVLTLGRDLERAKQLESPNAEDDVAIKVAIVGFSYNARTEGWGYEHYRFIKDRIDTEYCIANLDVYGPKPENIRFFAALCLGFLIGSYESDLLTDAELRVLEAQIPGIILLRNSSLLKY